MIDVFKRIFYHMKKYNLPIYHVQAPNVEKYTTTEADYRKGRNKLPPPLQRNFEEDLFEKTDLKPEQKEPIKKATIIQVE